MPSNLNSPKILSLPTELQTKILLSLPIFDQASASLTHPLWQEILSSKQCLKTRYPLSGYNDIPPIHQILGGPVIANQYPEFYFRCVVQTNGWGVTHYEVGPYGEIGYKKTHEWREEMLNDGPPYITECKFLDEKVLSPFLEEPVQYCLKRIDEKFGPDERHQNDMPGWFFGNDIFLTCFLEQDGKYESPLANIGMVFPFTEANGYITPSSFVVKRLNLTPDLTVRTMVEKIASHIGQSFDNLRRLKAMLPETIKLAFVFNKECEVVEQTFGWGLHCTIFFTNEGM
ncbi:hypothetical protein TWF751_002904 [Orbilia oligospora]|nr:hypothetical protein TWF751_002904 [Orbilia oligospora]